MGHHTKLSCISLKLEVVQMDIKRWIRQLSIHANQQCKNKQKSATWKTPVMKLCTVWLHVFNTAEGVSLSVVRAGRSATWGRWGKGQDLQRTWTCKGLDPASMVMASQCTWAWVLVFGAVRLCHVLASHTPMMWISTVTCTVSSLMFNQKWACYSLLRLMLQGDVTLPWNWP